MRFNGQVIELEYKQTGLLIASENQCIINDLHKIIVKFQKYKFHHFNSKKEGIFDAARLCASSKWKASALTECCTCSEHELHHFQTELSKLCKCILCKYIHEMCHSR